MKRKVEQALNTIVDTMASWTCVDSIVLLDSELDFLDPYFMVSLDVYYQGEIPSEAVRLPAFCYAGAFESNTARLKDRFIFEDLPFRIEYKSRDRFDGLLRGRTDLRDNCSYALYRLQNGQILFSRTDWAREAKVRLVSLDSAFWTSLGSFEESKVRHLLLDLKAAALKDDRLFFQLSLGSFLEGILGLLFTLNHEFQPSPRLLSRSLGQLRKLPEGFMGSLDLMLSREDHSLARLAELAEKMTSKVLAL